MSFIDTLRCSVFWRRKESCNGISRTPIERNVFLEFDYHTQCCDRSLDEFGEKCNRGYRCGDYDVLICTRRVCLVNQRRNQSFYFPPLDSSIIDVLIEEIDNDHIILVVATESAFHVSTVYFSSSPKMTSKWSVKAQQRPMNLHAVEKQLYAICYKDGSVGTLSVRTAENDTALCCEVHHPENTTFLGKLTTFVSSRSVKSSFFNRNTGHLLVLLNGSLDCWRISNHSLHQFEKQDSIRFSNDGIAVVASSKYQFIGCVILSNGTITPLSFEDKKLVIHAGKTLPKELLFSHVTDAAVAEDTVVLYQRKSHAIGVLCEGCENFNPWNCGNPPEDLMTILNLEYPVVSISAVQRHRNFVEFVLYHEEGAVSILKRFSNGEVLCRRYEEYPEKVLSLQWKTPSSVVALLQALHTGRLPLTAVANNHWNTILMPSPALHWSDEAVRENSEGDRHQARSSNGSSTSATASSTWKLSCGALGCAAYLGYLVGQLHHLYASPLFLSDLQQVAEAVRLELHQVYQLIHNVLDQGGWLEGAIDFQTRNRIRSPAARVQWRLEDTMIGIADQREAINAQAHFLSSLLNVVFTAIGYSCVFRVAQRYLPRVPARTYQYCRTVEGVPEVDWLEFITREDLVAWEEGCCVSLLCVLQETEKPRTPPSIASLRVPTRSRGMNENREEEENQEEKDAPPPSLFELLKEVSFFLSEKMKVMIHLYLLVYQERYTAALQYCLSKVTFLVNHQMWETTIALLESNAPELLPTVKLILQWIYTTDQFIPDAPHSISTLLRIFHGLSLHPPPPPSCHTTSDGEEGEPRMDSRSSLLWTALTYTAVFPTFECLSDEGARESEEEQEEAAGGGAHQRCGVVLLGGTGGTAAAASSSSGGWDSSSISCYDMERRREILVERYTQVVVSLFQWVETYPLNDERISTFEAMVMSTEPAAWNYFVTDVLKPTASTTATVTAAAAAAAAATTTSSAESDHQGNVALSHAFYRASLLAWRGQWIAASNAYAALAQTSEPLALSVRLTAVQRALDVGLRCRHQHTAALEEEREAPRWTTEALRLMEYRFLLQSQLSACLKRAVQLEDEGGSSPSPSAAAATPRVMAPTLHSPPLASQPISTSLSSDYFHLEHDYMEERQLYALSKRYRAAGGASIELDLLKLHADAPEGHVAEAMQHLLAFLQCHHSPLSSAASTTTAEAIVREVLQDPHFLSHFKAPFPLTTVLEFLLLEQQRQTAMLDLSRAMTVLLECELSPLLLFRTLLQLLWHQLQAASRYHEAAADTAGWPPVVEEETLEHTLFQSTSPPPPSSSSSSSSSQQPYYNTGIPSSTSPTGAAAGLLAEWQDRLTVEDIVRAARLVIAKMDSAEQQEMCQAQLEEYVAE